MAEEKKVYFRIYERMRVIKINFSARKNQGYRGNNEFLLSLILMRIDPAYINRIFKRRRRFTINL